MSEHTPITGELRGKMDTLGWYDEDGNIVFTTGGAPVSEIACLAINSKTFDALCDAIDAVHAGLERENAELRERLAVLDESADSIHDGWVRLPVDADEVPFHIGEVVDVLSPFGGYAAPAPIDTMELSRGASGYGWMVKLDAVNRASISPQLLRHHHAPTIEDVLYEFVDRAQALQCVDDEDALVDEYAAKLRLAGDAE